MFENGKFQKLVLNENPVQMPPHKRPCPNKRRVVKEVHPKLWQCIKAICNGEIKWPLFVWGSTGTGKSSAVLCMADRVEHSKFYTMPELSNLGEDLKAGRHTYYHHGSGGNWTQKEWWEHFAKFPLIVIDDVGIRESKNDFEIETLFQALQAREGLPLVCTSNHNEKGIEAIYGDRIRSRMCSGSVYQLGGHDRRYEDAPD